jgi:hypothetical protein
MILVLVGRPWSNTARPLESDVVTRWAASSQREALARYDVDEATRAPQRLSLGLRRQCRRRGMKEKQTGTSARLCQDKNVSRLRYCQIRCPTKVGHRSDFEAGGNKKNLLTMLTTSAVGRRIFEKWSTRRYHHNLRLLTAQI